MISSRQYYFIKCYETAHFIKKLITARQLCKETLIHFTRIVQTLRQFYLTATENRKIAGI